MNNSSPRVTLIVPFYNCERYLTETLDSICAQTFTDFECILINDASTDGSEKVVNRYLHDSRIIYRKNEQRVGIVANLNTGIQLAKGEYIARMDGDDVSEPSRLEAQVAFLDEQKDIDMVGTFAQVIDSASKSTGRFIKKPTSSKEITRDVIVYLTVIHGTTLMRRGIFDRIGMYRQEYLYCEDVDFTYRFLFSGLKAGNIPEYLYRYRYHDQSTAHTARANALRAFRLRRATIRQFHLKLTPKQWGLIFAQFIVGYTLSGRQRQKIERMYKKIVYGEV